MVASNLATNLSANLAANMAGGALTPAAILGANLRFRVDSTVTCSAAAWVDTIASLSLPGTGSPLIASDGANFRGKTVAKFDGIGMAYDGIAGVDIIAAGSLPYMYLVARAVTAPAVGAKAVATYDNPLVNEHVSFGNNAGVLNQTDARISGASFGTVVAPQAAPSFWEVYMDAAGVKTLFRDGVSQATAVSTGPLATAIRRVSIGAAIAAAAWANYYIAEIGICTADPGATARATLRTAMQAAWNVP